MISRKDLAKLPRNSCDYVALHAKRQQQRGRRPSAAFPLLRNPRKALILANKYGYVPKSGTEYLVGGIPEYYVCGECKTFGCKLWRESHTEAPRLLCAICAATDQKKNISDIDADGRWTRELVLGEHSTLKIGDTDTIGWYVPAIPTEDGFGYWSYTSVPGVAALWWQKLFTLPTDRSFDVDFFKAFSKPSE